MRTRRPKKPPCRRILHPGLSGGLIENSTYGSEVISSYTSGSYVFWRDSRRARFAASAFASRSFFASIFESRSSSFAIAFACCSRSFCAVVSFFAPFFPAAAAAESSASFSARISALSFSFFDLSASTATSCIPLLPAPLASAPPSPVASSSPPPSSASRAFFFASRFFAALRRFSASRSLRSSSFFSCRAFASSLRFAATSLFSIRFRRFGASDARRLYPFHCVNLSWKTKSSWK